MSRLATLADFEGGGLYSVPYQKFDYFANRANTILGRYQNAKVLVAGCGWGYLVDELLSRGIDAWGCDASAYATGRAVTALPATSAARVLTADCLSQTAMNTVKSAAGLKGRTVFGGIVTDDLLTTCVDEAEVQAMLTILRANTSAMAHILTFTDGSPRDLAEYCAPGLLWRTVAQWKTIIGNNEPLLDPMGREV